MGEALFLICKDALKIWKMLLAKYKQSNRRSNKQTNKQQQHNSSSKTTNKQSYETPVSAKKRIGLILP